MKRKSKVEKEVEKEKVREIISHILPLIPTLLYFLHSLLLLPNLTYLTPTIISNLLYSLNVSRNIVITNQIIIPPNAVATQDT